MSECIKRSSWIAVALWSTLMMAMPAWAASFDCGKAKSKVEHIICDDAEISKLDDELNESYKAALKDKSRAAAIKKAQKLWVKERNVCKDTDCVKRAYEARKTSLATMHTTTIESVAAMQVPATARATAQVNAYAPIQSHIEEVCLAPKIDWRDYEWTLIRGVGQPVCEEMLAYLKSRPNEIAPPTCPDERLPSTGNWTRPKIIDVSEEEKLAILNDIPNDWINKPVGVSYEQQIKNSKRLRVVHGDITRDGIPESMLAINSDPDMRKTCEQSKRCARQEGGSRWVRLVGRDSYDLLPMNEVGALVNWLHPAMGLVPLLMGGELVYYKSLPYWMSPVSWNQYSHDNFVHTRLRQNNPYSAMFSLEMVSYGSKKHPAKFEDVTSVSPKIIDPDDNRACRFGYFHRNNLK